MKWVRSVNKVNERGTFLVKKWYFKEYWVGPQGGASTNKNLLRTSPGMRSSFSLKMLYDLLYFLK